MNKPFITKDGYEVVSVTNPFGGLYYLALLKHGDYYFCVPCADDMEPYTADVIGMLYDDYRKAQEMLYDKENGST